MFLWKSTSNRRQLYIPPPVVVQLRTAVEELDNGRIAVDVQQHPQRRSDIDSLHEHAFGLAIETVVHIATSVHVKE